MRMPSKNTPSISPRLAALVMILAFNVGVVGAAKATTPDECRSKRVQSRSLCMQVDRMDTPSAPSRGGDPRMRVRGVEWMRSLIPVCGSTATR